MATTEAPTTDPPTTSEPPTTGTTGEPALVCGDGKVDPGEACDDGKNNGPTASCTVDCMHRQPRLVAGSYHTCALSGEGTVRC